MKVHDFIIICVDPTSLDFREFYFCETKLTDDISHLSSTPSYYMLAKNISRCSDGVAMFVLELYRRTKKGFNNYKNMY